MEVEGEDNTTALNKTRKEAVLEYNTVLMELFILLQKVYGYKKTADSSNYEKGNNEVADKMVSLTASFNTIEECFSKRAADKQAIE